MVTIRKSEVIVGKDGVTPVMHPHLLTCTKSSRQFIEGETVKCYINKYQNNRFAVWDVSWLHHNKYEVFSEADLHEHFHEA